MVEVNYRVVFYKENQRFKKILNPHSLISSDENLTIVIEQFIYLILHIA